MRQLGRLAIPAGPNIVPHQSGDLLLNQTDRKYIMLGILGPTALRSIGPIRKFVEYL
jgi:hypothetical protein